MKTYRSGEGRFFEEGKKRFIKNGEYRAPKKGEYYLGGAYPVAYKAPNDLSSKYWIAEELTESVLGVAKTALQVRVSEAVQNAIKAYPILDQDLTVETLREFIKKVEDL